MTTTSTFQGMNEDSRNSSRVLQPPGGGSSNIFGFAQEDSSPPKQPSRPANTNNFNNILGQPAPASTPAVRSNRPTDTKSNIFGVDHAPAQERAPQQQTAEKKEDEEEEGKETKGEEPQPETNPPVTAKGRGAFNPITGEAYAPPSAHTSTKVRQPPGGASSGLW